MRIGLAGNPALIQKETQLLRELGFDCLSINDSNCWQQIDGLVLSGLAIGDWHRPQEIINQLKNPRWQHDPILADGWGCAFLDRNISGILNCRIYAQAAPPKLELIHIPSWENDRIVAYFSPQIHFTHIAPNIAVLAHHKSHGAVMLRQGNTLAAEFINILNPNLEIYHYFKRMFN